MDAITHLYAGVPVADLDASIAWYTRFFGDDPVHREPIETYSNGVRHAKVSDPDGNAIAFAALPESSP